VNPWNVRETLYGTGNMAAPTLRHWDSALAYIDKILARQKARDAPELEYAATAINCYFPLLRTGRRQRAGRGAPLAPGTRDSRLEDARGPRSLTVARQVRKDRNRVGLLFLSADDEVAARVAALEAGGDDYMVKPFHADELVARVAALLRRVGNMGPAVWHVGTLIVDDAAHRVSRGKADIALSPIEYDRSASYCAIRATLLPSATFSLISGGTDRPNATSCTPT
jgi:hypothetical protein